MDLQIGFKLQKLRKERGFSQEELAFKLNVSRQAVSKWERGEAYPDTDNLIQLAKLYETSLDQLLIKEKIDTDLKENDTPILLNKANSPKKRREKKISKINVVGLVTGITPLLTVAIYLTLGAVWGLWHPGWIVFFAIIIVPQLAIAIKKKKWKVFPYPFFILVVYLCLGFILNLWHPTWILFLSIPIFHSLCVAIKKRKGVIFAYPILILTLYLCLGFIWGLWHPAWVIFTTIPIYYLLFAFIDKK